MLNFSEKPISVENGKKIFRMDCVVDSTRRPVEVEDTAQKVEKVENAESEPAPVYPSDGLSRDRWRLISAVKAWPTTGLPLPQLVDYGHDGGRVLQDAISIINDSKPDLTWNHSVDAKDVAGYVENAQWEQSADIPPGINADLVVDPEYDMKAAIGLKKGQLRNGSIGFTMDVAPSHEDMEWEDFVAQQGKTVDGEQVRWLPTAVYEVRHMALVPAGTGADKFAGRRASSGTDNIAEYTKERRTEKVEKHFDFFQSVLEQLGIDILLTESAEVSDATRERVSERIEKLSNVRERYNELAEGLQNFGKKLVGEDEQPLNATQVLAKLDSIYAMAKRGERLVEFKQREALEWFDKAKFAPDKPEFTESEKRMRGRIEASSDLDYLEDMIAEYRCLAQSKFELNKSSAAEELPVVDVQRESEQNIDIAESSKKLFG
jgi:hypothetical protein